MATLTLYEPLSHDSLRPVCMDSTPERRGNSRNEIQSRGRIDRRNEGRQEEGRKGAEGKTREDSSLTAVWQRPSPAESMSDESNGETRRRTNTHAGGEHEKGDSSPADGRGRHTAHRSATKHLQTMVVSVGDVDQSGSHRYTTGRMELTGVAAHASPRAKELAIRGIEHLHAAVQ